MKNHKTRKFLMTGTVLCALGLVLFGSGIAAGGKDYIANTDLNSYNGSTSTKDDGSHAVLKKTKIDSFSNLNVDFKHIDLAVKESEDDNFYLSYNVETTKGIVPVSWQVDNGTLNLAESNGHVSSEYVHIDVAFLKDLLTVRHFSDNTSENRTNQVIVYIPHDQKLNTLSCQLTEGDMELTALTCQNLNVQVNLGDLTLEDLNVANVSVTDKEGDISISESTMSNLKLNASLGDLDIDSSSFTDSTFSLSEGDTTGTDVAFYKNCQITSKMGDIDLTLPENSFDNLTLSLDTNMGDINVPDKLNGKLVSTDDESTFKKNASSIQNHLSIQSDDGDISIDPS